MHRASVKLALSLVALLSTSCDSCRTSGRTAAKEDLQLVPKETDIIMMVNLARARGTALWQRVLEARDSNVDAKRDYEDFAKKCALDPLRQIDSVFVALPQGSAESHDFVLILRGAFDENKLVECAKEQAKKQGSEVIATDYTDKKLYNDTKQGQAYATFLDKKTVALGSLDWVKKVVDLSANKAAASAKDNEGLATLMKRTKTGAAMWGAGLVPPSVRDQLASNPQLSAAGSMKTVSGSVEVASGLDAALDIDLGSDNDAKELVAKITAQLLDARKQPQVLMMGLVPLFDGIKIEQKAAAFHLTLKFTQPQVDDLINRFKGLLKGLAGGGAPSGLPEIAK